MVIADLVAAASVAMLMGVLIVMAGRATLGASTGGNGGLTLGDLAIASTSSPSRSSTALLRFAGAAGGGMSAIAFCLGGSGVETKVMASAVRIIGLTLIFGASGTTLASVDSVLDQTVISIVGPIRTLVKEGAEISSLSV